MSQNEDELIKCAKAIKRYCMGISLSKEGDCGCCIFYDQKEGYCSLPMRIPRRWDLEKKH